jgi:hypothetical protein
MPLGSAHRLAPEATFLDPDIAADAAAVERALEALAAFSPGIAGATDPTDPSFGLLEVQVDGLGRLWGAEPVLVERIVAALRPILPGPPRIGIAGTRFAATTAAGAAELPGRPWIVEPGGEPAFLGPLPAALLTPDPDIRARLARFGLRRIAAVAELPRSALVAVRPGGRADPRSRERPRRSSRSVPTGPRSGSASGSGSSRRSRISNRFGSSSIAWPAPWPTSSSPGAPRRAGSSCV